MAYFGDPAQIKIINFIPVRMVDQAQPAALLGSYTSLGNTGGGSIATVTMSARDVQLHLIAAGRLPVGSDDGFFGPASRTALRGFANSLPASARLSSVTWGSASYRSAGTGRLTIPQAWSSRFPPKARPSSGGGATTGGATTGGATTGGGAATTGGGTPALLPDGTPAGGAPPSGGGPAGIPERPSIPTTGGGAATTGDGGAATADGGGAPMVFKEPGVVQEGEKSTVPWMWIGIGTAAVVTIGAAAYFLSRR